MAYKETFTFNETSALLEHSGERPSRNLEVVHLLSPKEESTITK